MGFHCHKSLNSIVLEFKKHSPKNINPIITVNSRKLPHWTKMKNFESQIYYRNFAK